MIAGLLLVGGVIGVLVLAMRGALNRDEVDSSIAVNEQLPNPFANSVPSNEGGASGSDSDYDFPAGAKAVPIVPTDRDTWPAGDAIWDVARAIAKQEGYGVSMLNAPTRNNNPGDISDGFDKFGGEALDSKITRFPDPETGWNWLYSKLKNIRDGRSGVYSNNLTWQQFGAKWAADPHWPNGVTKTLGVNLSDRVGDYWDA